MKFAEVEEGLSINLDAVFIFESSRGNKTKVTSVDGKEMTLTISYDLFKTLVKNDNSLEKNVAQLARQNRYATP